MFCTKCGKKIREGAKFCKSCGSPVGNSSSNPVQDQPINYIQSPTNAKPASDKTGSKKIGLIIGIVAASLVSILAIICIVVFFVLPSFDNNNTPEASDTKEDVKLIQTESWGFPQINFHMSVSGNAGNVDSSNFKIVSGDEEEKDVSSVTKMSDQDVMNMNLVIDKSSDSSSNISKEKSQLKSFASDFTKRSKSYLEITTFNEKINNNQPFTSSSILVNSAIDSLACSGTRALYDALYWGVQRCGLKTGYTAVVAVISGNDSGSKYTANDVVEVASEYGVPVYIVGLDSSIDKDQMESLTSKCHGRYVALNSGSSLQKELSDINNEIKNAYKIGYNDPNNSDTSNYRELTIRYKNGDNTQDVAVKYMPKPKISSYENKSVSGDYVLPDSSTRLYTTEELQGMSIWDLYLARNEIYARHGRGFKHQDLREYFATKSWYHKLYEPDAFDASPGNNLSDIEKKNADTMLSIEKSRNSPYLAP